VSLAIILTERSGTQEDKVLDSRLGKVVMITITVLIVAALVVMGLTTVLGTVTGSWVPWVMVGSCALLWFRVVVRLRVVRYTVPDHPPEDS
jgi:fatty acid desaturase